MSPDGSGASAVEEGEVGAAASDAETTDAERRHKRFCIAVDNFIDLYKFMMVLAIGNCVRCLAQRQIQPDLTKPDGLSINLSTLPLHDFLMFLMVLIFIARFFLGDLSYWRSYTERGNKQVQVTDAINLLVNACLLTYMSFFIGSTYMIGFMITVVLLGELLWGALRSLEGRIRTTEGPLTHELNLGLFLSGFTIFVVVLLILSKYIPFGLPSVVVPSRSETWIIFSVILLNNIADLFLNGGRYLGIQENSWWTVNLQIKRNRG